MSLEAGRHEQAEGQARLEAERRRTAEEELERLRALVIALQKGPT